MRVLDFVMVIGISLAAVAVLLIVTRYVPVARREKQNDVLGFVYAVVGVIYAVVLAMTVIGVWEALNTARDHTYKEGSALTELYWYASSLPEPEHNELQGMVKEYTNMVVDKEWAMMDHHQVSTEAWGLVTKFRQQVQATEPKTFGEHARYQQALAATRDVSDARHSRVNEGNDGLPTIMWVGLILGAVVTTLFAVMFGMSSLRTHAVVVFSLTALMVFMLLLVFDLNYPFSGPVRVGPEAFELALARYANIP